jgi:nucleoid DNA-binding protein
MKELTHTEIGALHFELATTFDTTLTEQRYNEIMDLLLPTLQDCPEAQGTLFGFGSLEWRKRRAERNRKTAA